MRHGRSRRKRGRARKTRKPQQPEKRKTKAEWIKASIKDSAMKPIFVKFIEDAELARMQRDIRPTATTENRGRCPHCGRETAVFVVSCDGHAIDTHRCRDHGDVVPGQYPKPDHCQETPPRRSEDPGIYAVAADNVWDGEGP